MKDSKAHSAIIAILSIFFGLFIICCAELVNAADVTLSWDKPDDSRVVGYNIYVGTEKPLPVNSTVTDVDTLECVITDLVSSTTYQFMAKSYDMNNNESDPSEYLHYTISADPVDVIIIKLKSPGNIRVEE